jgi:hypothetical protein
MTQSLFSGVQVPSGIERLVRLGAITEVSPVRRTGKADVRRTRFEAAPLLIIIEAARR